MTTIKQALVGKRILRASISKDREEITFVTDAGDVVCEVDGGCCSYTWIESMDDPDALLGVVSDVEDIDMPDLGSVPTQHRGDVDAVEYYGLKITTDRGRCVIDYRNDSNGYYGGSLDLRFHRRATPRDYAWA